MPASLGPNEEGLWRSLGSCDECKGPPRPKDPNAPKQTRSQPATHRPLGKSKPPPGVNKYKYRRPDNEDDEDDEDDEPDADGSSELSAGPSEPDDLERKGGGRDFDLHPRASGSGSKHTTLKRRKGNGKEREVGKENKMSQRTHRATLPGVSKPAPKITQERVNSSFQPPHQASTSNHAHPPPHKHEKNGSPSKPKKQSSTPKEPSIHSPSQHHSDPPPKSSREHTSSNEHAAASTSTAAPIPLQSGISKRKKVVESDSEEEDAVPGNGSSLSGNLPEPRRKEDRKGKAKAIDRDIDSTMTTVVEEKPKPLLKLKLTVGNISKDDVRDAEGGDRPEKAERRRAKQGGARDPKRPRLDDGTTSGDGGKYSDDHTKRTEEKSDDEERDLGRRSDKDGARSQFKPQKQRKKIQDDDEPDPTTIVEGRRNRKPAREPDYAYSDEDDVEESSQRKESRTKNKRAREEASFADASVQEDGVAITDDAAGDGPKNKKKRLGALPGGESEMVMHKQVAALRKQGDTPGSSDPSSTPLEENDRATKIKGDTTNDPSPPTTGKVNGRRLSDAASLGGTSSATPNRRPAGPEKKLLVGSAPRKSVAVKPVKPLDPFADTLMRMSGIVSGSTTPNKEREGKSKNGINFRGAEKAEANRKRDELYAAHPAINLMLSHNAISRFEHETSQKGSAMLLYGVQQGPACVNGVRVSQTINVFDGLLRLRDKEDGPRAI